ncbi:MAG TPA: serine hydrolase [Saprospiraceae bacterium]|nr:serine hydrolase [Saprospiraceae bacterium]
MECDGTTNDSSAVHPKSSRYQSVLDDYVARGLPGITVAIRDESGLWMGSAGLADINKKLPYQYCHVSKAASITKMFVAALTFLLIEEGVLSLDDPLTKWLSDKQLKDIKNARQATIRSCLGHTTGIADLIKDQAFYLAVLNDPDKFWEEEELLDFVRGDDAVFPHGDSVKYSNTNTLLVALAIESATGRSHAALVREYLIEPLQLHHTYYYWHDIPPANVVAQGYFDLYNNGTLVNLTNYNTGSGNGYGGLYSTVSDLMNFVDVLFRNKTLLKPESLNQMLSFDRPEKDKNRQLGLGAMKSFTERAPDQFAYGHSGRDLGYTADAFYFPNQNMTLSFMVNYGTDAESRLQSTFFDFRTAIVDAMMIK